jgi:rod shape determining protein RodA
MDQRRTFSEKFDWTLCLILFVFFVVSCLSIYSAQTTGQYPINFVSKQIFWYLVGALIIFFIMYFDPDQLKNLSWYLYAIGNLLLLVLIFAPQSIAPIRNGAKSWFILPGLGAIQPSEFMKIFLILVLARVIVKHHEKVIYKSLQTDALLLLKIGAVTALPLILIKEQPDLGTSLVMIAIMLGMTLVSGISWKILLPLFTGGAVIASTLIFFVLKLPHILEKYLGIQPYQFDRIYAWLTPHEYSGNEAYHLEKSLSAIGSGMMSGKGFTGREVYIPESHSDFIFSIIGEEFGFIGGSIVIGLYFILIFHLIKIALDANDHFNSYVCAGIISMITFHVFQNIGMTIQVLPITGIPLPFISYGGSSLMGNMMAMGIVFSMQYHYKNYMFSSKEKAKSL